MDRETETVINRLMSDLKAAQDLSTYLTANNKKLRKALKQIIEPIGPSYPDSLIHNDLKIIEIARTALKD